MILDKPCDTSAAKKVKEYLNQEGWVEKFSSFSFFRSFFPFLFENW